MDLLEKIKKTELDANNIIFDAESLAKKKLEESKRTAQKKSDEEKKKFYDMLDKKKESEIKKARTWKEEETEKKISDFKKDIEDNLSSREAKALLFIKEIIKSDLEL